MHGIDEVVSRRTRQRCTNRIDLLHRKQATLQESRTLEPLARGSSLTATDQSQREAGPSTQSNNTSAEFGLLPPTQISFTDDDDDITMPTWGDPLRSEPFDYGARDIRSSEDEDSAAARSLDFGSQSDSTASSKSSVYDLAAEWSTDVGYSSGSEADIESNMDSHPELDDLLQMSPLTSRAATPVGGIEMDDVNKPVSEVSFEYNNTTIGS